MAKYIRLTQFEKKTVTRNFAMKWSTSARVDFYILDRQTRACSYARGVVRQPFGLTPNPRAQEVLQHVYIYVYDVLS